MNTDTARALDALNAIPPDLPREEWHEVGRAAIAAGLSLDDVDAWSANAPNYKGRRDVEASFRTISPNGGTGPGTLFHRAQEHGWSESRPEHKQTRDHSPRVDAAATWAACKPATPAEPYILSKRGNPTGLRVVPADSPLTIAGQPMAGALVVPAYSPDGTLQTLQFIPPQGKKLNMPGASFADGFFIVGNPDADRAYIVEGLGQAWACWAATGHPAVVSFGAGRMAAVAQTLRDKYARLVIVPDRGKEPQAAEIARAVSGEWVELPQDMPANYDANDYAREHGGDELAELLKQTHSTRQSAPPAIGADEWTQARPTPACVVEDYLFADVAGFIAPGGMGKTTLQLFEAVHIVLELPLYGLTIHNPGPVVILTAEDSREMLVARLRAIAEEMNLTPAQIQTVRERVRIWDVSGEGFKLTEVDRDVVRPGENIDRIIEACKELRPVLIVVDPAVSFGVGESRVNDAEQGLIEAARKLRTALGCCVRYVHHTGKANARDKAVDQYAGRGGSAFADGARMVAVLQSLSPSEWFKRTGQELAPGETGLVLARPKLSYAPPAGEILIRRTGYTFQHVNATAQDPAAELARDGQTVLALVGELVGSGQRPSKNTIEGIDSGLSRTRLRIVVDWLLDTGQLVKRDIQPPPQHGARFYLAPRTGGEPTNFTAPASPEKTGLASPPPLGITPAANRPPCVSPPSLGFAGNERRSDGEPAKRQAPITWEGGV